MPKNAKRLLVPLAAAGALLVLIGTAIAAAGSTTVSFSTPKAGSTISLHSTPYTAVAGGVLFAAANPQTTRFYLRRDGCGTSSDNPRLSTTGGTDAGDGCGLIVDSIVGVGGTADQAAFVDFPATDGMPLALDASRAATGVIDITGTAAGSAQVDVSMEALVGGQAVTLGSDSETAVLDPTVSDNAVAFTIHPDGSLAGVDLQGLDLRVHIAGPSIDGGSIGLSGKSWADVPSYTASVNRHVEISLDDPSFANAIPTRLGANGSSWSVALETPPVGKHTIYARSTQGYVSSTPTSTTFTIKR